MLEPPSKQVFLGAAGLVTAKVIAVSLILELTGSQHIFCPQIKPEITKSHKH